MSANCEYRLLNLISSGAFLPSPGERMHGRFADAFTRSIFAIQSAVSGRNLSLMRRNKPTASIRFRRGRPATKFFTPKQSGAR
jgi:hypothetical protein